LERIRRGRSHQGGEVEVALRGRKNFGDISDKSGRLRDGRGVKEGRKTGHHEQQSVDLIGEDSD
jgi:hypothetical protein